MTTATKASSTSLPPLSSFFVEPVIWIRKKSNELNYQRRNIFCNFTLLKTEDKVANRSWEQFHLLLKLMNTNLNTIRTKMTFHYKKQLQSLWIDMQIWSWIQESDAKKLSRNQWVLEIDMIFLTIDLLELGEKQVAYCQTYLRRSNACIFRSSCTA